MNFDAIRDYWEDRAAEDSSVQSTTQDVYLREIELAVLAERIGKYSPARVADVGCGDGRTTTRLASRYPEAFFTGLDYSPSMVENARRVQASGSVSNVRFEPGDVSKGLGSGPFDLIYTTRCLINLPSWDFQKAAIEHICAALVPGGVYLMIENFIEGQSNFNRIRERFDLPPIAIRNHNCFFERQSLLNDVSRRFTVEEELNISSTYYLVSRVVYSKMCAATGAQPDYFDDHHKLAAELPFCGEYGPVRLTCLRKL